MIYHGKYIMIRSIIKSVCIIVLYLNWHLIPRTLSYHTTWLGLIFSIYPGRNTVIQHTLVGTQFYDIPWSGRSFTTYHGQDAVLRHTMVRTKFYGMTWSWRSCTICLFGIQFNMVGTLLFNMSWLGRNFMTCPGRDAVLYVLWGHSYSTCPGWEAVIRHSMIGTQF